MPKVTDARDLLLYKLRVVYAAEKTIEGMLPKLAREAHNEELRTGFERHLEETREQVRNVERAFELLGEKPQRGKAPVAEALELEHKGFAGEASDDVLPEVLDMVALGSAVATEHHEIAAYESVLTLAESLGARELVEPLEQNLRQEQNMLQQVQRLAKRLGAAEARGEPSLSGDLADAARESATETGTPAPGRTGTPS